MDNRNGHYETTGPEIWQQTEGKIDGFICAVGSGGSLAGIAKYLREKNPSITIGLADPPGAALFHYFAHGELKAEGSSITEGISPFWNLFLNSSKAISPEFFP